MIASDGYNVSEWDLATRKRRVILDSENVDLAFVSYRTLLNDGKVLLTGSKAGVATIRDVTTRQVQVQVHTGHR